ncbi:hypothetical protein ACI51W_03600 [Pseudomonas marginalis]|uniref:hypothetical protein n=1 Tax=Pseudomonas marginalis TaxID=298 RepID=UPI00386C543A
MKKSLLAIALATIALSSTAQAAYVYKLPLEVAGGGSLPNGTISFGNGGNTSPVEPSEPEVIDPFEPENPACDPYAVGYPGNSTGKDLVNGSWYSNKDLGFEYRSCKLKTVEKPKLLARYASIFPSYLDECNASQLKISTFLGKQACRVSGAQLLDIYYFPSSNGTGGYNYANYIIQVLPFNSKWSFTMEDVDRIEIDGSVCGNLKYINYPMNRPTSMVSCDLNIPYQEISSKINKQIMIEIYGK